MADHALDIRYLPLGHDQVNPDDIITKVKDLQAMFKRLHRVRFDESLNKQDKRRMIANLVQEIKRLQADIASLSTKQLYDFEDSLNLEEIGFPSKFLSMSRLGSTGLHMNPSESLPLPDIGNSEHNIHDYSSKMENQDVPMATFKFMRADSSKMLDHSTPQNKWQSLFNMFKEWNQETNIAKGEYVLKDNADKIIDEEINQVRATIFALKEKKILPQREQDLVNSLAARLKSLVKAKAALLQT